MMRALLITTSISLSLSGLALAVHTPQVSVNAAKSTTGAAQESRVNIMDVGEFKKEVARVKDEVRVKLAPLNEGLEVLDREATLQAIESLKKQRPKGIFASIKKKLSKNTKEHAEAVLKAETVKIIKSPEEQIKRYYLILGAHSAKMSEFTGRLKRLGELKGADESVQREAFHLLAKWLGVMKGLEHYAQKRLVGKHQEEVIKIILTLHDKILTQYLDIVNGKVSVMDLTKPHQEETGKLLENQSEPLPVPVAEKEPSSSKTPSAEDEEWEKILKEMGEKIRSESKPSSRSGSVSSKGSRSLKAQDSVDSMTHEDDQLMPRSRHHTDRSLSVPSVNEFDEEDLPLEPMRKPSEAQISHMDSIDDSDVFESTQREESLGDSEESIPVRTKHRQRSVTLQASLDEDVVQPKQGRPKPQRAPSVNLQYATEDLTALMEAHGRVVHSFKKLTRSVSEHAIPPLVKVLKALETILDSKEGDASIKAYVSRLEALDLPNTAKDELKAFEWQYNSYHGLFEHYCDQYNSRGFFDINPVRGTIKDRDLGIEVSLSHPRHSSSSSLESEDSAMNRSQGNKSLEDSYESGPDEGLQEESYGFMSPSPKGSMALDDNQQGPRRESLVGDEY